MDSNEQQRLMHIKKELVTTTNTAGWRYIQQMAANIVEQLTEKAITEEDDVKGNNLRREAKALSQGFKVLFEGIEASKQISENNNEEPEWFAELGLDSYDTALVRGEL